MRDNIITLTTAGGHYKLSQAGIATSQLATNTMNVACKRAHARKLRQKNTVSRCCTRSEQEKGQVAVPRQQYRQVKTCPQRQTPATRAHSDLRTNPLAIGACAHAHRHPHAHRPTCQQRRVTTTNMHPCPKNNAHTIKSYHGKTSQACMRVSTNSSMEVVGFLHSQHRPLVLNARTPRNLSHTKLKTRVQNYQLNNLICTIPTHTNPTHTKKTLR